MSLFDVIRYPVSNLPTMEELNAIPESILAEWGKLYFRYSAPLDKVYVYNWYRRHRAWNLPKEIIIPTDSDIAELNRLRMMIKEYEAP